MSTININGGTIETSQRNDARNYRAVFGNHTEDFYTFNAAAWWLEMQDTIKQSRERRNAR